MTETSSFGPFQLLHKLADGGMATVWLARVATDEPGRELVIKQILPRLADDPEFRDLLREEARIATRLEHENLVRTWDFGDVDATPYIAMEYVWGEDLRRIVERGQSVGRFLPLKFIVSVIAQSARGLHHLHTRRDDAGKPLGLVHRDVSPPNLMVTFDGRVKVVDFGVARAASHWASVRPGQLKGKFGYMSPEQAQGLEVDARSDIFALGTILYELTTRRRLFRGDSDVETLRAIADARFDAPHLVKADYPPRLGEIVTRALARDRDDRWQTAAELADALESFLRESRLDAPATQLANYMNEIFPDRIEEIEEVAGAGYAGPTGEPKLPEKPKPVAPPPVVVPEISPSAAAPTQAKARPSGPVVSVEHDLAVSDDPLLRAERNSARFFVGLGVVAAILIAGIAAMAMFTDWRPGWVKDIEVGPHIEDIDAGPIERPAPPATVQASVVSEPAGAWIVVNGVATRSQTPAEVALVQNARNTVALYLDGHQTQVATFDVGTSAEVAPVTMVPLTQPADWTPPVQVEGEPPVVTEWSIPRGRIRVVARNPSGPIEGAEVLLNGEVQRGLTPLELEVDAGVEQHITTRLAGYRDAVTTVRARPWGDATDTREVILEMPADFEDANFATTLKLNPTPPDATISLDGEVQPGRIILLDSPGHYVVVVEGEDHHPFERAFDANVGSITLDALLEQIVEGPTVLTLNVEPLTFDIYAERVAAGSPGGSKIGTGTIAAMELDSGHYRFTIQGENEAGERQRARIEVDLLPNQHHTYTWRVENDAIVEVSAVAVPVEPTAAP